MSVPHAEACYSTPFFPQTCNGCIDLNVQRLCYGAQQCTIARCIGTLTNQNRYETACSLCIFFHTLNHLPFSH